MPVLQDFKGLKNSSFTHGRSYEKEGQKKGSVHPVRTLMIDYSQKHHEKFVNLFLDYRTKL